MKKTLVAVLAVSFTIAAAVAFAGSNPARGPNSYTAEAFNMSFNYPPDWKLKEMKMPTAGGMAKQTAAQSAGSRFGGIQLTTPQGFVSGGSIASQAIDAAAGTAQDTAVAGVSGAVMEQQLKKMMPKFASATLTNTSRPGTQIIFTAVEGGAGGMPSADANASAAGHGSSDSSCRVIEQRKTSWGTRPTTVMTMRCAQEGEFQYTMTATMKKDGADFSLIGMVTSKSEDPVELNTYLKSAFDKIIASTQFN